MNGKHGPGPIIHDRVRNDPGRFIVELPDGTVAMLTQAEVAAQPIRHQWFTGTVNGLLASWWDRPTAEASAAARGVLLGRVLPVQANDLWEALRHDQNPTLVILADARGMPLTGTLEP